MTENYHEPPRGSIPRHSTAVSFQCCIDMEVIERLVLRAYEQSAVSEPLTNIVIMARALTVLEA